MLQLSESMFCVSRRSTDTSAIYVSALLGGFMNHKDREVIVFTLRYVLCFISAFGRNVNVVWQWYGDVTYGLMLKTYDVLVQPHIKDYEDRQRVKQYRQYAMNVSYPSGLTPLAPVQRVLVLHNVSITETSEERDDSFQQVESISHLDSLPLLTERDMVPMYRRTMQGKNVRYVVIDKMDCGETLYLKKGKRYVEIG